MVAHITKKCQSGLFAALPLFADFPTRAARVLSSLAICVCSIWSANILSGQQATAETEAKARQVELEREDFVSDASFYAYTYRPKVYEGDAKQIGAAELASMQVAAGQAFLKTVSGESLAKVHHALTSPERSKWTNLPSRADDGGLKFREMNREQVEAVCELMATLLDKSGYQKMIEVMIADDQLLQGGRPRTGLGTDEFAVVVFGDPEEGKPWGFQLDGHHIGLNVSIEGEELTCSPSFIGTQPEEYTVGDDKNRPMGKEIEDVYKLLNSLSAEQAAKTVLAAERGDLRAGPGRDGQVPAAEGIAGADLTAEQQAQLLELISNWVTVMPAAHAHQRMQEIKSEIDQIQFGWRGSTEYGGAFSFSIQGPSLIIEHSCQLRRGNPREHMHSIYRNPKNEYGGQLK